MKRPSFQFYPADWRNNAKLRRCSEAARGAWIDVLCLMHDSDEYGVLRWPLADIARAAGVNIKLLKELADRDVLKGGDKGCEAYIHTPVHARKKGDPITLLEKTDGCCWYSSRFLTDEWRRSVSGGDTKFKSPEHSPSRGEVKGEVEENEAPEPSPDGALGDGATSTSSSSTSLSNSECKSNTVPDNENPKTHTQIQVGLIMDGLRNIQFMPFNPTLPEFLALIAAGATVDEFVHTALEKKGDPSKFNISYLLSTMTGRRQKAAASKPLHQGALPQQKSKSQSISEKRSATAIAMFGDMTNANDNTRPIYDVSDYTVEPDRPLIPANG